jgi:hypothetical protein
MRATNNMDASSNPRRTLWAFTWILPLSVAVLVTRPFDQSFFANFAFVAAPELAVLLILDFLKYRQPEFFATSATLAILPVIDNVIAMSTGGRGWFADLLALPGFLVGAWIAVARARAAVTSFSTVLLAILAPLTGVAAVAAVLELIERL